jgi:uncharacterized membrane protein (Fun14 family)
MNSEHAPKPDEPGITFGQRVGRAYHLMPHWTRKVLVFSLVLGIIGGVGEVSFAMQPKTRTVTKTVPAAKVSPAPTGAPAGSSGFVGGGGPGPAATPQTTTVTQEETIPPTLMQQLTPYATRGGFSLFVGIIFGVIFRAFLKISAMVTALALAGVAALSYFHVINLDRSGVQSEVSTGLGWVRHQATGLKNEVFAKLPSTTAAGVGFFFGLRRK